MKMLIFRIISLLYFCYFCGDYISLKFNGFIYFIIGTICIVGVMVYAQKIAEISDKDSQTDWRESFPSKIWTENYKDIIEWLKQQMKHSKGRNPQLIMRNYKRDLINKSK